MRCRESQKDPGLGLVLREIPVLQLKYLFYKKLVYIWKRALKKLLCSGSSQ